MGMSKKRFKHTVYYFSEKKFKEVEEKMLEAFGSVSTGYRILYETWFNNPIVNGSLQDYKRAIENKGRKDD